MRLHRRCSDAQGLEVNLHVIETPEALILIDGAISARFAAETQAFLDGLGKPVVAALLTHGHPDHFLGLGAILPPAVPILALPGARAQAAARLQTEAAGMRAAFGADFPVGLRLPDRALADGEALALGGVVLQVAAYGAAESDCDVTFTLDAPAGRFVICGDLVYNGMHPFLHDGHLGPWLAALGRLAGAHPFDVRLLPGHGPVGGPGLIHWTAGYLRAYGRAARALCPGGRPAGPDETARLLAAIDEYLPGGGLRGLAEFRLAETLQRLGACPPAPEECVA